MLPLTPPGVDPTAVSEAALRLRRAAEVLEQHARRRMLLAEQATAQWRGRWRRRFDDELDRATSAARRLAAGLRDAADEIERCAATSSADSPSYTPPPPTRGRFVAW